MCWQNYKIQFIKSSNIKQSEIRYDIEMNAKLDTNEQKKIATKRTSVFCIVLLLAKTPTPNLKQPEKNHSFIFFFAICVCKKMYK